jgi:hypothetical protein
VEKVQKPPIQTPRTSRAISSIAKLDATAEAMLEAKRNKDSTMRSRRRSSLPATRVAKGATTAATRPGNEISNPAVPLETVKSRAIWLSRPIGMSSVVTITNVPIAMEATAGHALMFFLMAMLILRPSVPSHSIKLGRERE